MLLDKILNNVEFLIEANGFTDPNDEVFNNPINNQIPQNGSNRKNCTREYAGISRKSCAN